MWPSCVTKATKDGNAPCARVATLCSKCRRRARPKSGRREIGLGMRTPGHMRKGRPCARTGERPGGRPPGAKKSHPQVAKTPGKSRGEGISGPKKAPGIRARNLAHSNMCPHKAVPFSGHGFRPRNSKTRGQFSCSGDGRGPPLFRAVQLLHRKPVIWPWPRPQLTPTTRPSPHPLLAAPVHASGPPRRLSETLPASSTHRPDTQGCHDVRDARSMAPGNMCVRVENVPRDTGMRRASHGRVHDLERGETTVNLSTSGVNNFSLRRASESARYCPRAQVMTTRSCNARRAHRPPCEPHSNRRCFKVFILEAPQQPNRSSSRCPAHGTKLYMPLPSAPF